MDRSYRTPKAWLTKTSGFLQGYDYSLNPYVGCTFACSYCYVRKMPVALFHKGEWGDWVDIKQGVKETFSNELVRAKKRGRVHLFMSSSTDPYQPVEVEEKVTRSLLEVMADNPPDFLFVQTRSPLVTRDVDILQQLGKRVRVSLTIETDLESVRKAFAPKAPPIQGRKRALHALYQAGIPTQLTVAPILPSSDRFAESYVSIADQVCIDTFELGDGANGKRSRALRMPDRLTELGYESWYEEAALEKVHQQFCAHFDESRVKLSQEGFLP
ncbi:SPL family radical SAM protein [Halalkalibacterium halodurans]|uniref:DNA photolyase n=1 Tax=Halalkalibacterium halodurans TaxID=86665 RepID=A0A0M0KKP7_ALKHA|nr:radical SAM protein [Halalkalibacterium halodurans]MED4162616.1 radical SAM protein [Halalkalibacterium halodurans]TPE70100.1 radical SAM protein [Halalkalibacterium halodurans]